MIRPGAVKDHTDLMNSRGYGRCSATPILEPAIP
jgi:hypothetical protein